MKFITTTEAAEIIGCTRQHVAHLVRKHYVAGEKFGRSLMVNKRSAEFYATSSVFREKGRPQGSLDYEPRKRGPNVPKPSLANRSGPSRLRRSINL